MGREDIIKQLNHVVKTLKEAAGIVNVVKESDKIIRAFEEVTDTLPESASSEAEKLKDVLIANAIQELEAIIDEEV